MKRQKFQHTTRTKLKMTVAIMTVTACLLPATSPGLTVSSISSVVKTDHERQDRAMTLDPYGKRGRVFFSHQKHESLITPDPNYPHKSISGVACVGCHHNVKQVTEANQFQKCSTCHKGEGDPDNPEDEEGYDLNAREIFHRSCIGCHRASNLQASNERFINASFTRCDECHDRQGKYEPVAAQSDERPSASEESEITAMIGRASCRERV